MFTFWEFATIGKSSLESDWLSEEMSRYMYTITFKLIIVKYDGSHFLIHTISQQAQTYSTGRTNVFV